MKKAIWRDGFWGDWYWVPDRIVTCVFWGSIPHLSTNVEFLCGKN